MPGTSGNWLSALRNPVLVCTSTTKLLLPAHVKRMPSSGANALVMDRILEDAGTAAQFSLIKILALCRSGITQNLVFRVQGS